MADSGRDEKREAPVSRYYSAFSQRRNAADQPNDSEVWLDPHIMFMLNHQV